MKPTKNRVLYNGDVNFLFATDYRPESEREGPYTAKVLDDHVDRLADNGVDTHLINVNAQLPWYVSRSLEHILTHHTRGDTTRVDRFLPPVDADFPAEKKAAMTRRLTAMFDHYLDLHEAGVDWPAHLASRSRERGMSPWVSIRLNDAHGVTNDKDNFMDCPARRVPENRLRARPLNPRDTTPETFPCCSYEKEEVRDYYLAMIREVLEDYDFDGIELDWLRTASCCEPPASEDMVECITEWHGRVRELAQRRAALTGKPFFVSLRVPARFDALRTIGIDVAAIARRGYIDCLAPSNYFQTAWDLRYDEIRRVVGDAVSLYGVIECIPNWLHVRTEDGTVENCRLLPSCRELTRAAAAGRWSTGVDGIEIYNFFAADEEQRRNAGPGSGADYGGIAEAADPDGLRGKPKHYCLATQFQHWSPRLFESADQIPTSIETGGWRRFEFAMCAEPTDASLVLVAQIVVDRAEELPELGVSLNGMWPTFEAEAGDRFLAKAGDFTHHTAPYTGLNFRLPLDRVRDGWNELIVFDGNGNGDPRPGFREIRQTRIVSVELAVLQETPRPDSASAL